MTNDINDTDWVQRNFAAANALEALGNYQEADEPLERMEVLENIDLSTGHLPMFTDDESFWRHLNDLLNNAVAGSVIHADVGFYGVALSEWTPRIPGLFWRPYSKTLRKAAQNEIESETSHWRTFSPIGKSAKVSGGIGTVRLPPSVTGYRLACATASLNASTGVPVLVSSDVWEGKRLEEGSIISGQATLRQLPGEWARNFPTIKGIPKLCLVLDNPDEVTFHGDIAPVLFHPFSIMEYWDTDAQLLDFVYCQADSHNADYRQGLEDFFERYRRDRGRDGRYLTAADVAQPMWDAEFSSPSEMRRGNAQKIKLIEARALEAAEGRQDIDALIRLLSRAEIAGDLKRISDRSDIPWRSWLRETDTIADQASRLAQFGIDDGEKLLRLTQAAEMEFSG